MSKSQPLKQGEKVLFAIVGAFFVAALIGYVALETIRLTSDKPLFATRTHFNLSEEGKRGSQLFREARCTSCHRAMRNGTNMGLSLDGTGSRRTRDWVYQFLVDPEPTYGAATLDHGAFPKEAAYVAELPVENLRAIAVFLSELRSEQGSPSSPVPPEGKSEFIDSMVRMWAPAEWQEKYTDVRTRDDETTVAEEPPRE